MKISLNWIRDYVAVDLPLAELLDRLTMIGLVPESVETKDGDTVIDLETYANRPDTLGHLGVAREIAVMLCRPLAEPPWPVAEFGQNVEEVSSVEILDDDLCPRYCGMVVRGITVGPSPDGIRKRLEALGLRPINNVVDASNYVLYGTGQPIHTFDFAKLSGGRIVVRRARRGETLRDLEGRTIALDSEMLVIADDTRPVALAGIIGGAESAVSETTHDVFIESANFDPVSIRRTSKKLGLATDASYRYERGADVSIAPKTALMTASLLTRSGARAARGVLDVYPKPRRAKSVILRARRVTGLLGVEVPEDFIAETLARLGFKASLSKKGVWRVESPEFRVDIEREADLIEEIARFYGYDRIPSEVTPARSFEPAVSEKLERIRKVRQALLRYGFDEAINASFADPEKEAVIGGGREPVVLRNPISVRASVMRTNLLMGLLENAAWNTHRGAEGVHIFEVANTYFRREGKTEEHLTLGLVTMGLLPGQGREGKAEETDFFILKGAVEAVAAALRYEPCTFDTADAPHFEPGKGLALVYQGRAVGRLGHLKAGVTAAYALDRQVFAAEIDLAALFEMPPRPFAYVPVPKYPGVHRDLSFFLDEKTTYAEVQRALARAASPLLEGYELIDRFRGPSVPEGKVSLSIRFHYRHPQRTLLAEEVDRAEREIIAVLEVACHIQRREGRIDNGT